MAKLEAPDALNMKSSLQELIIRLGKNLTPDTGRQARQGRLGLIDGLE